MPEGLDSILPSVAILGIAVVVALVLTIRRGWADGNGARLRTAVRIAVVATVAQAVHFSEEWATGFHVRFPQLFGLEAMPLGFFVTFNVAWLVIWSLSAWGLAARHRVALFPLWFLGIGCALNGVAHPLLALYAGEYFPGLGTSPMVGILGVLLLRRLRSITRAVDPALTAA